MEKLSVKGLIDSFVEYAIIQGEATINGDYKTGNKASDKLFKIGSYMEENIETAKQMLDVLLMHKTLMCKYGHLVKLSIYITDIVKQSRF